VRLLLPTANMPKKHSAEETRQRFEVAAALLPQSLANRIR